MKKFFSLAAALAVVSAGCFTSCQEEDFGLDSGVIRQNEYAKGFEAEFGKPDANQRWDFYAQAMEQRNAAAAGITRATTATTYTVSHTNTSQPAFIAKAELDKLCDETYLPDTKNNSAKGTRDYTLTYGGKFTVSAILYAGLYETQRGFEFGIAQNVERGEGGWAFDWNRGWYWNEGEITADHTRIFGYKGQTGNPGYAAEVELVNAPVGTSFDFYIKANGVYRYTSMSESILLATDEYKVEEENEDGSTTVTTYYYRMIGFEDMGASGDLDFNDCVVVLSSTVKEVLPAPATARYFCEDLYQRDFDFNDVVFDVSSTGVTLLAVGGTLPVYLSLDGGVSKTGELHELMGGTVDSATGTYSPINVGAGETMTTKKIHVFETPLSNEAIAAFKPILYVGRTQQELDKVNKDVNDAVEYNADADIPSIIQVPSDVKWTYENVKISKAYPTFYKGENGKEWYEVNVQDQYLY